MSLAEPVLRAGTSHGWALVSGERKRELIAAVLAGRATEGPLHAELDVTDRCNVACYFCNQQDTRTALQIPFDRLTALIDELAAKGLASVRLSGGGDPLHYKGIVALLDHFASRGVVVDNLTTNAAALDAEVAERLVAHRAREVNVSLNAADAADYARMMQVKPAIFGRVLENTRRLVELRGAAPLPVVTVQFLLDKENAHRALEMDESARSTGCDRVVVSAVQQIPNQRVAPALLLGSEDAERLLPVFTELFRRHPGDERLEVNLDGRGLGEMVRAARRAGDPEGAAPPFPTAASFREEDGGCFFAWYSTAITGNGNVYPCCQLIRPEGPVLGNVLAGGDGGGGGGDGVVALGGGNGNGAAGASGGPSGNGGKTGFEAVWQGDAYRRLREEMREVLVEGADREHPPERFTILPSVCHEPGLCWLKNVYFRADEAFYRELRAALGTERRNRERTRRLRRAGRALVGRFPRLAPAYDRLREASRPARRWLKRRLGLGLTEAS